MENGTKLRILYLYQYLIQNTDDQNPLSTVELVRMLEEKHGMKVARNTISNDLSMLIQSGLNIEVIHSTQNKYYYDGAAFEVPEIKLLIDAVSASKFITAQKSEMLINKLMGLVSRNNAQKLRRYLHVEGRVKTDNQCGYYIVDTVNEAIDTRRKISFHYTEFNVNKERVLTNDGQPYTVSPYTLVWDGDYYYLRGYCDERNEMRNFRLDRIEHVPEILQAPAEPKPEEYDTAEYSRAVFRMYDADRPTDVKLRCDVCTMKAMIDNFGNDVKTEAIDDSHFSAIVKVCTSPTFFRWIFGFEGKIKIVGPASVVNKYKNMLRKAMEE